MTESPKLYPHQSPETNLIGYISDKDFGKEQDKEAFLSWKVRRAVRVVLFNDKGQIALMHIGKSDVYKLPGGGVDDGESLEIALSREILEETGCEVEKTSSLLGITIEKRNEWKMFQISHCYLARATMVQESTLTDEEREEGFTLCWADSVEEAIQLVGSNKSERYDDKYIGMRDLAILENAKGLLASSTVDGLLSNEPKLRSEK